MRPLRLNSCVFEAQKPETGNFGLGEPGKMVEGDVLTQFQESQQDRASFAEFNFDDRLYLGTS